MTFRKNLEREKILLSHWRRGNTVKRAALLTGIPQGTISHYYRRYNKHPEKYVRKNKGKYQEPPKTSPFTTAAAGLHLTNIHNGVSEFVKSGDYAGARDFLQVFLLLVEVEKVLRPQIMNADPKKWNEVVKELIRIVQITKS